MSPSFLDQLTSYTSDPYCYTLWEPPNLDVAAIMVKCKQSRKEAKKATKAKNSKKEAKDIARTRADIMVDKMKEDLDFLQ